MSTESSVAPEEEPLSLTVCSLCRQRKTKCDRRLPNCGFCIKAKVDCRYVARPNKRGLRAGYVTELEVRLENLETELQELKKHVKPAVIESPALLTPLAVSTASAQDSIALSTPDEHGQPRARTSRQNNSGSSSAVHDMMSLPRTFFFHLADIWFKETQTWVPILNQTYIRASLESLPTPVDHIEDIELRSLVALEVSYSTPAICLGYLGRRRLSQYLRSQVIVEAMAKPSMSSLRALLIIAILDYGSDDIPSTFSLLAICRRTGENIGIFRQLLKRIEGESPAQVGPPSTTNSARSDDYDAISLSWCVLGLDAVSSLGVSWRDVSAALIDHISGIAFISTPDFRDSFRTHTHLAAIGLQPVHEFLATRNDGVLTVEEQLTTCEGIFQNLMSYVDGLPETSYTLLDNGVIDFDICQIFTLILSYGTIILLYQGLAFHEDEKVAEHARQRCLTSCEKVVSTIRSISDGDAEINNSPLFTTMAFVAARFQLCLYKALGRPREPLFDFLMHGINMLARRWQYARRLDIVLRAAITELDSNGSIALPAEFWDLRQTHLDISESLKTWVMQHKPSLYIGNLDGPYV